MFIYTPYVVVAITVRVRIYDDDAPYLVRSGLAGHVRFAQPQVVDLCSGSINVQVRVSINCLQITGTWIQNELPNFTVAINSNLDKDVMFRKVILGKIRNLNTPKPRTRSGCQAQAGTPS